MESAPKRPTDRRAVIIAAGAAAVAAVGGVAAQSVGLHGRIILKGGAVIPEGRLEVYLDDPAVRDRAQQGSPRTSLKSDGKSATIHFSVPTPAVASPTLRIVARLERADGWLLARGSARFEAGAPLEVALRAVVY